MCLYVCMFVCMSLGNLSTKTNETARLLLFPITILICLCCVLKLLCSFVCQLMSVLIVLYGVLFTRTLELAHLATVLLILGVEKTPEQPPDSREQGDPLQLSTNKRKKLYFSVKQRDLLETIGDFDHTT